MTIGSHQHQALVKALNNKASMTYAQFFALVAPVITRDMKLKARRRRAAKRILKSKAHAKRKGRKHLRTNARVNRTEKT